MTKKRYWPWPILSTLPDCELQGMHMSWWWYATFYYFIWHFNTHLIVFCLVFQETSCMLCHIEKVDLVLQFRSQPFNKHLHSIWGNYLCTDQSELVNTKLYIWWISDILLMQLIKILWSFLYCYDAVNFLFISLCTLSLYKISFMSFKALKNHRQ